MPKCRSSDRPRITDPPGHDAVAFQIFNKQAETGTAFGWINECRVGHDFAKKG